MRGIIAWVRRQFRRKDPHGYTPVGPMFEGPTQSWRCVHCGLLCVYTFDTGRPVLTCTLDGRATTEAAEAGRCRAAQKGGA